MKNIGGGEGQNTRSAVRCKAVIIDDLNKQITIIIIYTLASTSERSKFCVHLSVQTLLQWYVNQVHQFYLDEREAGHNGSILIKSSNFSGKS